MPFLRAEMELRAGNAEQMVRQMPVQRGDQEVDLVLTVGGLVEGLEGPPPAQTTIQRLARERQARRIARAQVLGHLGPEFFRQTRDRGLSGRPVGLLCVRGVVGIIEGFGETQRVDHGRVVLVLAQLGVHAGSGISVLCPVRLQRRERREGRKIIIS